MRRPLRTALSLAAPLLALALLLAGCGGGSSAPPSTTTQILSSYTGDGDVVRLGGSSSYTLTSPPVGDVVYVGLADQGGGIVDEYVTILDFPLDALPLAATVSRGVLNLSYVCLSPGVTLRLELIDLLGVPLTSYSASVLWDNTVAPLEPLASVERDLPSTTPTGGFADLDVTGLVRKAQELALPRFQLRVALSGSDATGFATIDDPLTGRGDFAPLLHLTYR